ncbi:MAG: HAMP domain-containing histidine kinase [Ignavibacteriaceae bacterium]|nr:HAMP domain-containing histidine kinase [Ignavibacteriaceae bacterium]
MAKNQKSKFYFFRNFGWKLLFLSLILAGGAAYLLRESFYPNEFEILENIPEELEYQCRYHDFDHDGFSEMMEIRNYGPTRYNIKVYNWNGGIIDQANYWETIREDGLSYYDITGDGFDEILGFTQQGDSLYFYAHNLITKKAIIKRLFIDCVEEPLSTEYPVDFFPVCIADTNIYPNEVFIFAARSHNALKPRNIYALDLDNKKIIKEFVTKATIIGAFPYDLNNDGDNEIIMFSIASGNVQYPAPYKDDQCWLFVLDQKLNPVFPPLSFSQYPSLFYCLPIEIYSERYIMVVPEYIGDKNLENLIYMIDSKGKVYLKEQNPFHKLEVNFVAYNPIVDEKKNPSIVYGWKEKNKVIKLSHQLKIIKSVTTEFENPRPRFIKDVNNDGKEEIFYMSEKCFLAFDEELSLLAKFPDADFEAYIGYRLTGPHKPVEIILQLPDHYYRLQLIENKLSSYLPLIFIGFAGLVFLFLNGSFSLSNRIINRSRILKYIRSDSSEGILLVDNNCLIVFFNNRFAQILNLNPPPKKGEEAVSILNHYPQLVEILKKSRDTNEIINEKVLLSNEESGFKCEVSVQPFKYLLTREKNYLIAIKTANMQSHTDKIHTWSRAVQKMAHDIKTPLSTVALNLKILQTRLEKIELSEKEQNELSDDIQMMRTELDNIQTMTKNFLKFSNLDKPHFQAFDVNSVIEGAKSKFQPYINEDLAIEVIIDKDVKPIWADPQQIEMVFTILIENALAAIQGRGLININVSSVQYLDNIFSESIEIEIADTGPGIKEEDKKRIFEPYYSTKSEGTGMGLSIAKKIIEDNGGIIEVYSKPNFGAVFRFSLPIMKEENNE